MVESLAIVMVSFIGQNLKRTHKHLRGYDMDGKIMYCLKTDTIGNGFQTLVKKVMENGLEIKDERDSQIKELLNVFVTIKDPLNDSTPDGYFWEGDKLDEYKKQFMNPDDGGFVYTYGNRLRGHFFKQGNEMNDVVDQLEEVINRLKNYKLTRRATMTTFDPGRDHYKYEIPCMILIDFKIRDGKLHTTGVWRSHDIYGAWFPNVMALSHMAQYVAYEVGVEMGTITVQSISAHIYEVNWEEACGLVG